MKKLQNLGRVWNLDAFFKGGPASPSYLEYLDALEKDFDIFAETVNQAPQTPAQWGDRMETMQRLQSRMGYAGAFISCHGAADVMNLDARALSGRIRNIGARLSNFGSIIGSQLLGLSDDEFNAILADPKIKDIAFNLAENREKAKNMLSPKEEAVISALSINGYHGWNDLYNRITGAMKIEVEEEGEKRTISPGQLQNRLSHKDAKMRAYYMDVWDKAWNEVADPIAVGLNQLAGFRLNLYKARGWDDFLFEPLTQNRMQAQTLESMYKAIENNLPKIKAFIQRKKQLLKLPSFGWQDVDAPMGENETKMSYDEAANFIVENFEKMSPRMANLAVRAFEENWIESEDRPGKRMGGFCSGFPEAKESRIFVTFSGSMENVGTVAHELGHAYHGYVLRNLPPMAKGYAMNVAETASTFAEVLVGDAAIAAAKDENHRINLIESKLRRGVTQMTNLVCRFIFEKAFYEERAKGEVSVERLNQLMESAQKKAFGDSLDRYHPTFWASKLHFHNTRTPFYNFPYTFGYLFATGIYAAAKAEGPGFEDKYDALLMDTGRSKVEDLAKKHLNADITKTDFWQNSIDLSFAELDQWLALTENMI